MILRHVFTLMGRSQQSVEDTVQERRGLTGEGKSLRSQRKQEPGPRCRADLRNFFHYGGRQAEYRSTDAGRLAGR